MATPKADVLTKVSTEGATDFVHAYHTALSWNKNSISRFYSPTPTNILFNGNVIADGAAVQEIFTTQLPSARYEIQSVDCQVINPSYPVTAATTTANAPSSNSKAAAKNVSMLVVVSGFVQYGEKDAPQHGFSETFVLIPNADPKGKDKRDWVIQSQNFRLVV